MVYMHVAIIAVFLTKAFLLGSYIDSCGADFADRDQVGDTVHLKQHLESKIDVDGKEWDKEQQFFHYFQVSDLNRDSYIDGVEVSKAISHQHEEQARAWSDEEIESAVDPLLKKMDANSDGFIDYTEYRLKVET